MNRLPTSGALCCGLTCRPHCCKAGERQLLIDGLKLTLPLYHTDETKGQPPFAVSATNFANSVTVLVEYAGVNKSAANRPQDFYTLQYLPK
jgi:NitT/TauT family transport system substrate-binding protein